MSRHVMACTTGELRRFQGECNITLRALDVVCAVCTARKSHSPILKVALEVDSDSRIVEKRYLNNPIRKKRSKKS